MRNPVKTAKRQLLRVGSCALSALMVLGSIPAAAIGDGVTATYDEAYYAMTDYYGNLTDGSVVKSYRTNGIATLTDYGDYDEIINLTDGTAPARNGGKTTFRLDEKALPGTFYFEGKTTKPFQQLPWTISMSYTLNGVPTKAEDLAGQAGVVEIRLDIVPNGRASEYARNNYTLEAMAIFNQDDILSLEAPGAQVQLIGNLRAVLFLGLPGEECHYTIRVGSEDFAFGGLTFLMVPATLSQLEEIAKLSERKDDLEENYNKLSGSIDSLLDAMTAMTGSLNASANGLEQLNKARGIFSDGKGVIYSGTDALREDLSNLADVLEPVEGQIEALSKTITDSKSTLRSMTNTVSDLKGDLKDVESALRDLEDGTGDVRKVFSALGSLRKSLKALQEALGGTVKDTSGKLDETIDKNQNVGSTTVNQVKEAHSAYVEKDRKTFYQDLLELKGTENAGETAATAAAVIENLEQAKTGLAACGKKLTEYKEKLGQTEDPVAKAELKATIDALESKIAELEGTISLLQAAIKEKGIDKLETAYQAKAQMTFQQFCQQVLGQSAATAKQMNDLWLVYASGKVEYFSGASTPFIAPTIISCVQLGATVDYAILMTSRFQEELQSGKNRKEAIRIAADSADASIITSALVMFCATLGVSFVSSIDLIGAICIMLARGALISACICLFVMPAVLYVCEPMFNKTTLHWRTEQPKKESKAAKALKAASEKLPARKEKAALPEKGTEQTETTEPAEAADSTKLAAESETEADAARETANV